jgi:hypoxanthine phosphoribosyltransferase
MAASLSSEYQGEPVTFIGVLKGSTFFLSDLGRQITSDARFEFIRAKSYTGTGSTGKVTVTDLPQNLGDKHVVLVEDILDTGLTLANLVELVRAQKPLSLRVVVLLDKPGRRPRPVEADLVGFTIDNDFVVGYGLDCDERFRQLPDICVVEQGDL